jgi:hypothetical protein
MRHRKHIALLDRQRRAAGDVEHVNGYAPSSHARLRGVEQTARDVDGFGINGLAELRTELKLPKFKSDGDRYQFAWPPPQPSLAAQMASAPVPRGIPGPDWHSPIDERDCQRRAEGERLSAFYEKREREAEERREAHRRKYGY